MLKFGLSFYKGEEKKMSDSDGSAASGRWILFLVLLIINMVLVCYNSAMQNYDEEDEMNKKSLIDIRTQSFQFTNTFQLLITSINIVFGSVYLKTWVTDIGFKITFWKEEGILFFYMFDDKAIVTIANVFSFLFLVFIILIFGTIIPKFIGNKFSKEFLKVCYPITWVFMVFAMPFASLITWISKWILRIFGMKNFEKTTDVTEKGIISMVNEGQEMGVLEPSEAEMITNIFEYGDKDANDIMIRRKNIVAIEASMKMNDAIEFIANENYSRIPVFKESIDNIIGILHLKDLMRFHKNLEFHNKSLNEIDNLIRNVQFIPETRKIDDIFKMMQTTKEQMVIVIDEYGQTSGLIAMEDILEEIVGNILDEYDEEDELVENFSEDEFIVSGKTRLEDLEHKLNVEFDEEDFDTLNGYIISKLDRIPVEDEEFSFVLGQYIFKINHVENKMIHNVLIKKINDEEVMDASLLEMKREESEGK